MLVPLTNNILGQISPSQESGQTTEDTDMHDPCDGPCCHAITSVLI
jgi:hypothetical protein